MRLSDQPSASTAVVEPDARLRALAFVGRVVRPGFVFTAKVQSEIEDFAVQIPWAMRKHGYDVVEDPSVDGWKVVRRAGK